jgi:hypothetical protein
MASFHLYWWRKTSYANLCMFGHLGRNTNVQRASRIAFSQNKIQSPWRDSKLYIYRKLMTNHGKVNFESNPLLLKSWYRTFRAKYLSSSPCSFRQKYLFFTTHIMREILYSKTMAIFSYARKCCNSILIKRQ